MIAALALSTSLVSAQVVLDQVPELQGVDVVEHLGQTIPLNLTFTDDAGRTVTLGDYFANHTPVLLTLGYYECPMLCNLVLNGVIEASKKLSWRPGQEYRIVTVSIDPLETSELAAAKKRNYIEKLGIAGADAGWAFLVGDESQSRALADAVGFRYVYDSTSGQYAHPAVIMLMSPDGKITRYLYGISFSERDLRLALFEASEGKIGSTLDRIILSCYHYDPNAKGYVLFATKLMRLGGAASLFVITVTLGTLWLRERRRLRRRTVWVHDPRA
ncbi:MAG TPA: SCO family protein [Candidatus Deferrimicrobium sp.]|nr:SCO family protein [Candidatus Deferrimicrobium sp.]